MSMNIMVKVMKATVGNHARKLVLLKLADNANDQGECFPSYDNIADNCEMSRRTAIRHIQTLEEEGFLTIEKRRTAAGNSSNIYRINQARLSGDKTTPPSDKLTPPLVTDCHHPGDNVTPPPSDTVSPITSHSSEPVIEPIKKINKKGSLDLSVVPDWLSRESIQDFIDHRREIKKPMTQKALVGLINKLKKHRSEGFDPCELLNDAVIGGWQTVYPKPGGANHANQSRTGKISTADRQAAAAEQYLAQLDREQRDAESDSSVVATYE